MKPTSNTTRNHGLVLTSMREQPAAENERLLWRAYYRNALRNATCTSCTCNCKAARKGCGNFTPKAEFTTATRRRFAEGRSTCA
jgi:hypothetical protein